MDIKESSLKLADRLFDYRDDWCGNIDCKRCGPPIKVILEALLEAKKDALERAARVAENMNSHGRFIAQEIRALEEKG